MKQALKRDPYDVVIMGGGPGGSTLAALLRQKTNLSVALFEKEAFPRDHIGESFSHRVIHPLAESGALDKVIWSGCAIKKFGGFYAWDAAGPSTTFFDHADYLQDGIERWALHVDRAEFDKVLLDHARSCGVDVFEQKSVVCYERSEGVGLVSLDDSSKVQCRLFVEASGRRNNLLASTAKSNLSTFKNMAVWCHLRDGKEAHSAQGSWNIFRDKKLSPIGCFACEDGWYWYIPVPKIVDGRRDVCHSLGLVTNPDILKVKGKDYLNVDFFMAAANKIPILGDLITEATPIKDDLNVATNYSMINDQIANFDKKGILLGDAAFFVDPLFSSGVAFALNQALAACAMIRDTLTERYCESDLADLWHDYDHTLRRLAHTYALSIDQWYYGIAKTYPKSTYWRKSRFAGNAKFRANVFQSLVDTSLTPDLLQVLTHGSGDLGQIEAAGPISSVQQDLAVTQPEEEAILSLHPAVKPPMQSLTYAIPQLFPASTQSDEDRRRVGLFWSNPILHRDLLPEPYRTPEPCMKFFLPADNASRFIMVPLKIGQEILALLMTGSATYQGLLDQLGLSARPFLQRLVASKALVQAKGEMTDDVRQQLAG